MHCLAMFNESVVSHDFTLGIHSFILWPWPWPWQ